MITQNDFIKYCIRIGKYDPLLIAFKGNKDNLVMWYIDNFIGDVNFIEFLMIYDFNIV